MDLHTQLAEYYVAARRAQFEGSAANYRLVRRVRQSRRRSSWRNILRLRRAPGHLAPPAVPTLPAPASVADRPAGNERRVA